MSAGRDSGILLHISSLQSRFGIGDMGPGARDFAKFLQSAGQSLWQILPLTITDTAMGNSPYSSISAFAGNPLLISPELLIRDGLLSEEDLAEEFPSETAVDYPAVTVFKERILRKSFERFRNKLSGRSSDAGAFEKFRGVNAFWLDDFALFSAIKKGQGGTPWYGWPPSLRDRDEDELARCRRKYAEEIDYQRFVQYLFFDQWFELHVWCDRRGIRFLGDIPIYVNHDSADVWTHPGLFQLDQEGRPSAVAGVPPDYFSETGQLWGNPLYRWDRLQEENFDWWMQRIGHAAGLYDMIRIDHFRGLLAYWSVPPDERTAINGRWIDAPHSAFFQTLKEYFPHLPILAENLGVITRDVTEAMERWKFPGMLVLLFAFDENPAENLYAPHNHTSANIVYTGTHDNNTVIGHFAEEASAEEWWNFQHYAGRNISLEESSWEMIRMAMSSVARIAIIPMQDVLGLGSEARMNAPSSTSGNWKWRMPAGALNEKIATRLAEMTELYGRGRAKDEDTFSSERDHRQDERSPEEDEKRKYEIRGVMAMKGSRYREYIGSSLASMMEADPAFRSIAYFSMEIGIKTSIPTYSGGLGILAGDILKSAADLGVPMVGITLLYRKGYFDQEFNEDGWQKEKTVKWHPEYELTRTPSEVIVTIEGRKVRVHSWIYNIVGAGGYTVPIYLLDTDLEGNAPEDRRLSHCLYGGDNKYRLCQEIMLGVGGLRALRDLGYCNIRTYHLNEGHAGFLSLELLREQGYDNYEKIRDQVVFTTHTPVPAGHDFFRFDVIDQVMGSTWAKQLRKMLPPEGVSMTELGLRYSHYVNGVSKKHGEVSRKMFNIPSIDHVTNGVHPGTWASVGMKRIFSRHIPGWENDPSRLILALQLPDSEIWNAHQASKMRLLAHILETTGRELDADKLTIAFARRAALYKRPDLLFSNIKRLVEIGHGRIQFILSGKAHPRDDGAKALLQRLRGTIHRLEGEIGVIYLDNYDMKLGALLTQGVDLWLNTPSRPHEASGTSGMKCALNGVLNFSVLDGWWIEGCVEGVTGWSIGPHSEEADRLKYDEFLDAEALYSKLRDKIIPTYYDDRKRWIWMMKHAIALNASYFNTHRVVKEYCEKAYGISFRGI